MKKLFSIMSNVQTHYRFKLDLKKVDQYARGKWLIHGTKHRKDNKVWWLYKIPTSTTRFRNDVGYRMAKILYGYTRKYFYEQWHLIP